MEKYYYCRDCEKFFVWNGDTDRCPTCRNFVEERPDCKVYFCHACESYFITDGNEWCPKCGILGNEKPGYSLRYCNNCKMYFYDEDLLNRGCPECHKLGSNFFW